jgi:cation transport ATPase
MNIFNQLREVLERFPAQGCIFVSDGATDALVTPINGTLLNPIFAAIAMAASSITVTLNSMTLNR